MQNDSEAFFFKALTLLVLLCLPMTAGCYYTHLASGQMRLMLARESTEEIRADPETPEALRAQLELVERARHFATVLGLEVDGRYTSYVDWPGDRIVTTVVATRPGEVEAAGFDFPIVGRVPYKGFFDVEQARALGRELEDEGLDVCLVPVTAYSTLGWLDDPLTAPMLRHSPTRLAETVFHELVHTTVFVESQPTFNEGIARFIGQEAAIRFFANSPESADTVRLQVLEDRTVATGMLHFRDRVAALYDEEPEGQGRQARRDALDLNFRTELSVRPLHSRRAGFSQRVRLNDACLAISGTYASDTHLHEAVLVALDGDLNRFVERLRQAADEDDPRDFFFGPAER
jgi:predicted aminopeptidase